MILVGLAHIAVSTLLALALSTLWGHLTPLIAFVCLSIGLLAGFVAKGAWQRTTHDIRLGVWTDGFDGWLERILFAFLFYVSLRHFLFLFYPQGALWKTLNPNNLGDLPLHINYIRAFSLKNTLPLINPEYAFDHLRYPLGLDLYNALWEILGVPMQGHLFLVGLFGAVASLVLLRAYGGWWAMLGVFLSGGWAGWELLHGPLLKDPQSVVEWKNIFMAVLVTQRGFLYALPVGVFLLHQSRFARTSPFWFGIMWASLGLFHMHTFLAVSLMLGGSAVIQNDFKLFKRALVYAVPLATIFVLYETGLFTKGGFVRWAPGWSFNPQQSFIGQAAYNFGPYLYLFILLGVWLAFRAFGKMKMPENNSDKNPAATPAAMPATSAATEPAREGKVFRKEKTAEQLENESQQHVLGLRREFYTYILYIALFTLFLNLIMAPWAWDNIKLLIWPYIGLLALTAKSFRRMLNPFVQVLAVFVLGLSGFLAIVPSLQSTVQAQTIFDTGTTGSCLAATRNLPREAVFLASTSYQHPLEFWGRIRAYGYEGHVWSHGIKDEAQVKQKMTQIMTGAPNWRDLAHEIKADYIYWGPDEIREFGPAPKEWQQALHNVSTVEGIAVYEIK